MHVDVWLPLMLVGTHVVVTPEGEETAARETVPLKPPLGVRLIVEVPLPPAGNETVVGLADTEKSAGGRAETETPIVVVWARDPLVPLTVTAYEPAAEEVSVHVDVCEPAMLVGAHVVVTPEGLDDVVRATEPLNPPITIKLIVEVTLCPTANETLFGLADKEKSGVGGATTETLIGAVRTMDPFVPVTVTVYEPAAVDPSVHVESWLPAMLEGAQLVVTPDGLEEAVKATVPLKPPLIERPTYVVAVEPGAKDRLFGLAQT